MLYGHAKDYVLKLINNIYGQKQAWKNFADYRDEKLKEINFQQVAYVDDGFFRALTYTLLMKL